jgi:hypothetical protein
MGGGKNARVAEEEIRVEAQYVRIYPLSGQEDTRGCEELDGSAAFDECHLPALNGITVTIDTYAIQEFRKFSAFWSLVPVLVSHM